MRDLSRRCSLGVVRDFRAVHRGWGRAGCASWRRRSWCPARPGWRSATASRACSPAGSASGTGASSGPTASAPTVPWRTASTTRSGDGRHRPHRTGVMRWGSGPSRPHQVSRDVRKPAPASPDHGHDPCTPDAERKRATGVPTTVRGTRLSTSPGSRTHSAQPPGTVVVAGLVGVLGVQVTTKRPSLVAGSASGRASCSRSPRAEPKARTAVTVPGTSVTRSPASAAATAYGRAGRVGAWWVLRDDRTGT